MSNNIVNISLKSKTDPTVNITIENGGSVSGSGDSVGTIKFIATGESGPTGSRGPNGQSIVEDNAVTSQKIAADSINNTHLQSGSVYGDVILNSSISNDMIVDSAITGSKIQDGTITADKISNGTINRDLLSADIVTGVQIEDGTIFAAQIANNNVVRELIQGNAVGTNEIEDDVTLNGTVTVTNLDLLGQSPARITGPTSDSLEIKSNTTIDFKNTSNTTIASLDQNGNLTITGTVDGIDVGVDVAANTAKTSITTSQSNAIVANTAKETNVTTNLSHEANGSKLRVNSSDGEGVDLPASTTSSWGVMTNDMFNKLDGVSTGAEVNVNADWNSTSGDSEILNKPTLLQLGTTSTTALAGDTTTISTAQSNAITANTAKVGITTQQASDITTNNSKVSFPGLGTTSTTALAGDTTTISGSQASAITANTAKVGITTSQADAITANTAKVDLTVENAGTVHASNYTDTNTTYDAMGSGNSYAAGLVPAGSSVHSNKFLRKDGTFVTPYIYLGMDGIALSFNAISVDLKANGGLVIESGKIALDLGASSITNNLSEATSSADGLMSTAHHDKLDGIASGAEVNVQSDWNATSGDAQILNKPTIPAAYTDANAVSAVSAADNYIKNDANEVLAGSLEISEQLFVVKSTGGSKTRFRNSATTTNRTLDVPDASGTLALVNTHHHFIHAGWFMSYPYARYIPLNGSLNEQNTATSSPEYVNFTFPYDGYVKKMILRSETDMGSTNLKLYKGASGATVTTVLGDVDATVGASAAVEFDFTSVSNAYSKGDTMAIKVDPTEDPDGGQNITIELIFDLTT